MNFKISDYKVLDIRDSQKKEVIDYGVEMLGAPLEWGETRGKDIKVGIIDTGIDLNHEDLQGRIKEYVNFTTSDRKNATDDNGHGTHVAGIIAAERNNIGIVGVAPEADLYIAKAFDKDGSAEFNAIRDSIQWMAERNVDVINMSFSSQSFTKEYQQLISEVSRSGISLICAAGNEGISEEGDRDTIGYPARFDETVAVTAVDTNKKRTDFSSVGSEAEIAAAGKDIYSCYMDNSYATLSGTSMATPMITGAVTLLQSKGYRRYKRRLTPEEIRLLLHIYSEDLGDVGRDSQYGFGLFSFGRINKTDYVYNNAAIRTRGIRNMRGMNNNMALNAVIAAILLL
ncbi:S8 family peptidase [Petroclostridium sp. X23]|uniref:S8 family peptidase n=1 Tax=Petroclostridium sp. X23 TaxID=3045146 RepID=UPI0024AE571C|nr:S8 family peptidase [Petroclostridium sp. X23]WHH59236.1 S8 family peptidase [Petroclostridium sp. X23]